jgi:protease-4
MVWGLLTALGISVLVNLGLWGAYQSYFQTDAPIQEKFHSLSRHGRDKIAIVRVEGMITDGDGFVRQQIEQATKDPAVKAVVLRVDSPGGTVAGSDSIYHQLVQMVEDTEMPLVVSMGGLAASGGYYVSMAVGDEPNTIYAEPATWTGSIGVIIPHYNVAGLMQEWKIEEDSVKSHPLKQMGSPTRPMTEQERAIFQGLVDDFFTRFKDIIKKGRPRFAEHPEELDAVATGQVFTTNQSIANGLVDREGFLEHAIERAAELADLDVEKVRAVQYQRQLGLLDTILLGPQGNASITDSLTAAMNLSAPRAYYLSSWLPSVLSSPRAE